MFDPQPRGCTVMVNTPRKEHHPYPPFDFNFFIDTEITRFPVYKPIEDLDERTAKIAEYFDNTPYLRGSCNICGKETVYFCKNLAAPRDYLVCMNCGSVSRYRSLARGIISAIQKLTSVHIDSLADLKTVDLGKKITIYDTQIPFSLGVVTYPIPYYLSMNKDIKLYLSYFSQKPDRHWVNEENVSQQNLESLKYKSETFDLVITSDVMEHVRLPHKAHAEIARVVKSKGFYLFTVPHDRTQQESECYVKIHDENDPAKDEYLVEPIYHGDPNSKDSALVYTNFGLDLDKTLQSLGFNVVYTKEQFTSLGIVDTELFYCKKI